MKEAVMRSIGVGVLSVFMTVFSPWGWDTAESQTTSLSPAPAFEIVTSAGDTFSNATLKGRPVLLVFWAPWCNVCRRELPELATFYQQRKPERLGMVAIAFADLRSNVDTFIKNRPEVFIFPSAYDEDRWLAQAFKVNATPTYVALDAEGRIALVHRGGGVLQDPRFQQFLAALKS
jgi:thiol-disulfide isomerase/thioredoxin